MFKQKDQCHTKTVSGWVIFATFFIDQTEPDIINQKNMKVTQVKL
jgi:hypothetical protein